MSEERVKPRGLFVEEAIQFALESRWADALAVNQALVERHGEDEETLNRIGKALTELGQREDALAAYSGSLRINPLNLIAQKNVRKLTVMLESKNTVAGSAAPFDVELFTEEPGKSAITVLSAPSKSATVSIAPGDVVELYREGSTLRAQTSRGVSLGEVDTKIARRLVPLMETGNRYSAAVARLEDERVEIILRETYQAAENARKSSFPLAKGGRREEGLASYSASLQINPLNLIAQKNVRKLTAMLESKSTAAGSAAAIDVELFTEEPGKSAITVLSAPSKSATVDIAPGDVVELYREGSTLRAQTSRGVSLGEVDTKIARRLVPLMETGNRYSAAVARLEDERVEIILRETYQAAENARKSSFPLAKGGRREEFRPYAKDSLLSSREIDSTPLDDDGEEIVGRSAVDDAEDDLGELGMSTFQSDAEETPPGADTEDDDDSRPEDEY